MGLDAFCEILDSMMSQDYGARGQVGTLYSIARKKQGGVPLTKLAIDFVRQRIRRNDTVLLTTGWLIPGFPQDVGETDGPLGTAALVRALNAVMGVKSVVLVEKPIIPMISAAMRGLGLNPVALKSINEAPRPVVILPFPTNWADANKEAKSLLDKLKPSAAIAVEKGGANENKEYHITIGVNATKGHIKADEIFYECSRRGIPTIGIGDGGNEIGMGLLRDEILEAFPFMSRCSCPCAGSIPSKTATDLVVVGATSNLACYSICAGLASDHRCLNAFFDPPEEKRMAEMASAAGAVDGILGYSSVTADGIPGGIPNSIVNVLNLLVRRFIEGQPGEEIWAFDSRGWKTWVENIGEQRSKSKASQSLTLQSQ